MKKWIALILTAALLAVCCVPALAVDPDPKYADALKSLGLFQGTDKGYELEKAMTREQGVVMIIRLLGKEKAALECKETQPFTDFADYPWFAPYAAYAYSKGITKGVSDTVFGYGAPMTEAMFLTMLLRVLGYQDANDGSADFVWSDPFALAKTAKIITEPKDGEFTREAMTERCWNVLFAKIKDDDRALADSLIESGVFTDQQLHTAEQTVKGGSSAGGSSSGSGNSGGSGSGSSGGGSTMKPGDEKPVKPNETPRIPMP